MIKILTNLTDEEMARLKYVRRLYWHWRGTRTMLHGKDQINNQELTDRGIKVEVEPYVEYVKRPPHDMYLWSASSERQGAAGEVSKLQLSVESTLLI